MTLATAAQQPENIFLVSGQSSIDKIHSLFATATETLVQIGSVLSEQKEQLGKQFKAWVEGNELAMNEVSKLIKLSENFDTVASELTHTNPLTLLRLLGSNSTESAYTFVNLVEELQESDDKATDFDIIAIKKVHDVKIVKAQPKNILRIEVKEPDEVAKLNESFSNSDYMSYENWLVFLNESNEAMQQVSEVVLGRKISKKEELPELLTVLLPKEKEVKQAIEIIYPTEVVNVTHETVKELEVPIQTEWHPLTEVISQLPTLNGIKAKVIDTIRIEHISFSLQELYKAAKGGFCEIIRKTILGGSSVYVDFNLEEFKCATVPMDWFLVEVPVTIQ